MKDLHLKFEAELNEKKKFLESKRKEFDTKIEKWERGHSQRKIAWAENSIRRNTELESEAASEAKKSQKNTPNQSFEGKVFMKVTDNTATITDCYQKTSARYHCNTLAI